MRTEIKKMVEEMAVEAINGANGSNWPQEWVAVWDGHYWLFQEGFYSPRSGYEGDTSRLTWWDTSDTPEGVEGKLQFGYRDSGFCRPKYNLLGGLTPEEFSAIQNRMASLIAATGRDLRDEFDGADCPNCGERFCSLNGTQKICSSCIGQEQQNADELAELAEAGIKSLRKAEEYNRLVGGEDNEVIFAHLWAGFKQGVNPLKSLRKAGRNPRFVRGFAKENGAFYVPTKDGVFTVVLDK